MAKDTALAEVNLKIEVCVNESTGLVLQSDAFRQDLILTGTAQQLVKYESLHKGITELNRMLKEKNPEAKVDSFNAFVVLVFCIIPWLFGVFKMLMAAIT